ncbi:MAG: stage II sporulation protein M [Hyphomonas sp.]|uniref:stage II sporulation protein M n=1 Tax=Hyphomonas sp. TaxID=87 RepID=UPI0017FA04F4|nr:stage II sporulation protein M [Hyphomonas sp.]MBA3067506.1 stage II sporulation protein M [Hyphomonas sp.]MBU4063394.1 stage II sporulation protein M [Alphaproteobacteria bacterium]MBU4165214.1 stage II sporulation protein M [Alphaproteobacteria bacterium]
MSDLLKSYRFREERQSDWQKLDLILTKAENGGVKNLSDEQMLALPRLYRQAVSSLSVARSISLDQNVVTYLESLCTRSYFFVYGARTTLGERMMHFLRNDWPVAVSQSLWTTLLSALFFFGGWALAFFLCLQDMDWFWTFHGHNFLDGRNPDASVEFLKSTIYMDPNDTGDGELAAFSSFLFNNNAQIALFAFALGFAFGIPTAWLLVYNGVMIGSMYAVFWDKGLGYEFTGWLMIHGVTELSAIVLAGAAGFVIGGAVAFPGGRTRLASARVAGQKAATMAMGCVVMLILAAILEGFGRQLINSDIVRYLIAGGTLVFWLVYFYVPRKAPGA